MQKAYQLHSRHLLVCNFHSSPTAYVAFCQDNMRLDIAKCRNYLPPVIDPMDHCHYMWVQSLQGFFILRQQIREKVSDEWYVVAEVTPDEFSSYFFEEAWDLFPVLLDRLNQDFPMGGLAILDLAPLQRLGSDLGL